MICCPAVLESPSVATSAVSPIVVPRTVRSMRPGRANMPAKDSKTMSRADMLETGGLSATRGRTVGVTHTGARTAPAEALRYE